MHFFPDAIDETQRERRECKHRPRIHSARRPYQGDVEMRRGAVKRYPLWVFRLPGYS